MQHFAAPLNVSASFVNMKSWSATALATLLLFPGLAPTAHAANSTGIVVDGTSFALHSNSASYRFHVDSDTGDLITDHFGGLAPETVVLPVAAVNGWVSELGRIRREYPDSGRGDFRTPAVHLAHSEGYTVSDFRYVGHDVSSGKTSLDGLPSLFAGDDDVSSLVVHLYDNYSNVALDLSYSVFPGHDAFARSAKITNKGSSNLTIERAASLSIDFPVGEYDMIGLHGDWAREAHKERKRVGWGLQGFGSTTGYSSHLHNPFLALTDPATTENSGNAYGFSLIYTGSHEVQVERGSQGFTRAVLGINPLHLSWNLGPGESFTTPEAVTVYSDSGLGGMSRKFHSLFRSNLIKSSYVSQNRPVLLNSWEGLSFNYNQSTIMNLAQESADLGVKLFVLDDGWFGDEYPRVSDNAGLGDWVANPARFPNGIPALVSNVTALTAANSSTNLKFGLWFEPEMVNPNSTLYHTHPDWVLSAGPYPRTLRRNQLVLDLSRTEVQDYVINAVASILSSADISYVKWDNNRGMHELPTPATMHGYMLGMYRVFDELTSQFPDILWEGCASGGGRFDPGVLQYFPQIWTSDDTDGYERLAIQFGTSLVYPPSAMGAHVSEVPNQQVGRTTPLQFRAHVAMMGGSWGLELDPADFTDEEKEEVPGYIALAEKVNPIVISGDFYRLQLPEDSNWPAAMFISPDGSNAVVFYFQVRGYFNAAYPTLRLAGLDPSAKYSVDGNATYSGATLMNAGIQYAFSGDYDSTLFFLERQ